MTVCAQCHHVTKHFGQHAVLDGIDWLLERGSVTGLLGDSGAGKTTLLRILAGLERCSSGRVDYPAAGGAEGRSRRVGMVFQNLGLWPHLTARQHVEYVLSAAPRGARHRQAEQLLEEARLPMAAWERRPAQLSGGEGQRVALARAFAVQPELLLLDEPLSQLDMTLRAEMLELIRNLVTSRQTTVVYVTHSWPEALELCERLAVLSAGRLVQEGPTGEVFHAPATAEIARLTGPLVELPAAWARTGRIRGAPAALLAADAERWYVRPQQVRFVASTGTDGWRVLQCRPHSHGWRLLLAADGERWTVVALQPWEPGTRVAVTIVERPSAASAKAT